MNQKTEQPAVILVWKLWTVYARMIAGTVILSCVIINLLNGNIFKMSSWRVPIA